MHHTRDSFRKIVVLDGNATPWTDEDGVMYMGVIPFLLSTNLLPHGSFLTAPFPNSSPSFHNSKILKFHNSKTQKNSQLSTLNFQFIRIFADEICGFPQKLSVA